MNNINEKETADSPEDLQQQQEKNNENNENNDEIIQDIQNKQDLDEQCNSPLQQELYELTKKKKINCMELLYGQFYDPDNKVKKLWRKTMVIATFVSMLRRAYDKIKYYGAIRNQTHIQKIEHKKSHQDRTLQRKQFIIYPNDKFKQVWNLLMVFILIAVGLITPFRVCIVESDDPSWFAIDIIFDCLFAIDLIVNFCSAYIDQDNKVVDDWKLVAWQYLTGWFIIDFLAILPFNYFMNNDTDNTTSGSGSDSYNKLLRLLRLPRLYRLLRLLKLKKQGQDNDVKSKLILARVLMALNINEGLIKIIILLINILFLNHIVACFWFFLAKIDNYSEQCWVVKNNYLDKGYVAKYIAAFYWSFQTLTTVGYGDIPPMTPLEQIYSMIWMFFGVGFFSYTLGNLSSIMGSIDKKSAHYNEKVNQFNDFAFKVKLPIEIRNKVHIYYQNNFTKNMYNYMDPKKLILELPYQLQLDVLQHCYEFLSEHIGLFKLNFNFTAAIVLHLQYIELDKDEVIYREGDHVEEIYFLQSGRVALMNENGRRLLTMVEGTYFGEIEAFESIKRKYFAVATQPVSLYFCKKDIFVNLVKEYPIIEKEVQEIMKRRKEKYQICRILLLLESQQETPAMRKKVVPLLKTSEHCMNILLKHKERIMKKKKLQLKVFKSKEEQKQDQEQEKLDQVKDIIDLKNQLFIQQQNLLQNINNSQQQMQQQPVEKKNEPENSDENQNEQNEQQQQEE